MDYFKQGDKINLINGEYATIVKKLGEGGQGVVYDVIYDNSNYALKWYKQNKLNNPQKFYENLKNNTIKGAPSGNFLWPLLVTEIYNNSFGYLMGLRPKEYKDFGLFLTANEKFKSDIAVINAAINLINGFLNLHAKGYSYQDLNDGNFFINPENGDVLICDNDNVAPYGDNLGIAGKCRYMAPEVVLSKNLPDIHTDRYSLAVVLFLHFCRSHPLEGARTVSSPCMTDELEKKYFGSEPIFCCDPNNNTNRPVRGIHNNVIKLWPAYPEYIQNAFIKSFSNGLTDREDRLTEREWHKLLIKLRDETIECWCGCENFMSILDDDSMLSIKCLSCGTEIAKPLVLSVNNYKIALMPKSKLYEYHTNKDCDDYTKITGEVVRNKKNPNIWGIKNLTDTTWIYYTPDNHTKTVCKNEVVPIFRGIQVSFNGNQGQIK